MPRIRFVDLDREPLTAHVEPGTVDRSPEAPEVHLHRRPRVADRVVVRRNMTTGTKIEQYEHGPNKHSVFCADHRVRSRATSKSGRTFMAGHPEWWCHECHRMKAAGEKVPRGGYRYKRKGINRLWGVEIEAVHTSRPSLSSVARKLAEAGVPMDEDYETGWAVKRDGSVTVRYIDFSSGYEIVSPPLKGEEGLDQTRTVLRVLQQMGFKINHTCGLHLHLDARDMTMRQIAAFARTWHENQELIDWLVNDRRRQKSRGYTRVLTDAYVERVESFTTRNDFEEINDRYYVVNFASLAPEHFGTIEIRQLEGTLSYVSFESWLRFSCALVDTVCAANSPLTKQIGIRRMLDALPVDDDTKMYLIGKALSLGAPMEQLAA